MWPVKRQKLTAWLALIAVTLQLVLSFGHVHPHDKGTASNAAVATSEGRQPSLPTPVDGHDDDDAQCAICWSMALARSVLLAQPQPILPPIQAGTAIAVPLAAAGLIYACPASFQARGPPAATLG
jgi:hypothetical protein